MAFVIPGVEPTSFMAGDTIQWKIAPSLYPTSEGWACTYQFRGPSTQTITATVSNSVYNLSLSATLSAALVPGEYWLFGFVSLAGEQHKFYEGRVTVYANQRTLTGAYDGRTHAEKTLAAIEAAIEGNASREEKMYLVRTGDGERRIEFCDKMELIKMRGFYVQLVQQEKAALRISQGLGSGNKILTRFVKP